MSQDSDTETQLPDEDTQQPSDTETQAPLTSYDYGQHIDFSSDEEYILFSSSPGTEPELLTQEPQRVEAGTSGSASYPEITNQQLGLVSEVSFSSQESTEGQTEDNQSIGWTDLTSASYPEITTQQLGLVSELTFTSQKSTEGQTEYNQSIGWTDLTSASYPEITTQQLGLVSELTFTSQKSTEGQTEYNQSIGWTDLTPASYPEITTQQLGLVSELTFASQKSTQGQTEDYQVPYSSQPKRKRLVYTPNEKATQTLISGEIKFMYLHTDNDLVDCFGKDKACQTISTGIIF